MSPVVALVLCRFLHDAAAMVLWGGAAFLATLVPARLGRDMRSGGGSAGRSRSRRGWPWWPSSRGLPLETAMIGSGWSDAIDPGMLRAVLLETTVGAGWAVATAASLLVAVLVWRRAAAGPVALAAGVLLTTMALGGHAIMREGWPGLFQQANFALHALSAGAWFGALAALLPILDAFRRPDETQDAAVALQRFSSAGVWAVALVVLTGAINTGLILGAGPVAWGSTWQVMLAAKLVAVGLMAALALRNRLWIVPQLGSKPDVARRSLRAAVAAEIGLGLAAIALVADFGMRDPA